MELRELVKFEAHKRAHDRLPVELARLLRAVRDQRQYRKWGYRSFRSYLLEELQLKKSRAYHLISVLSCFERVGLSGREIDELSACIGWAKCVELLPVLTGENKEQLIFDAIKMTEHALRRHVRNLRPYVRRAA